MKKIAVILSGCGFKDGAEITEAVSTLISITEAGAQYQCFAPDKEFEVTNHVSGEATGEKRNVLDESARICRGDIQEIAKLNVKDFDGLAFPGGFGAALNLCTFGKEGANCSVLPDVKRVVTEFNDQSKPVAAICIAPALIAKVLGEKNVTVTIGNDKDTASEIEKTGAQHEDCPVTDFITDREHKVITTPAYMFDEAKPSEVFTGIRGAIKELVEMS